ncbi:thiamine phosphate synthase [Acidisoma cladoniae]|jgi:thiamine-phosphate diphosphorylase|uniref:thiamine phosphate synthase n=1 Tax=Acidisoma cladoniae TaxID=3040935 RepID=UPI00254F3BF4|nr:thiamine phosphate synthase [Acidisoma sp. PAMC 29798]
MTLDPFYLIVDDAALLVGILPTGVQLVQLRIKDATELDLRRQVRRARALCEGFDTQLILNDHWQMAIDEGLDFVHLGQEDLETADIPALRDHGVRIGLSTHDEAELDRALSFAPDYVALGPVFPTILKAMTWAPQGVARVSAWKRTLGDTPLVAIGGLTPDRGRQVLEAGADSACVVTDVIRNTDPVARAKEWMAATAPWRV